MPIDPNDGAQPVSNTPVLNTPDASQSVSTTTAPASTTPDTTQQSQPGDVAQTPQSSLAGDGGPPRLSAPSAPDVTVKNAPVHPSVQKAGVVRQVAQALAGGPRYTTTIDPQTGITTRTQVPLSNKDIALAIAMEAISGGLTGLAQTGPGATGRAAAAGFQQAVQQRQQADAQQEQQAQSDYHNQVSALTRKAQAYESAQRAILNTAQAERYGVESLKDAVSINAPLLSSYQDASAVSESNVSQDALQAGMQSGKYNPTEQIAIPDGFTNINGRYEQTFSIVNNPSAKLLLTTERAKAFADAGIPGWTQFKTGKVPDGYLVPGTMLANANAQLQAIDLMKQDVSQVADTLAKSDNKTNQQLAKTIPDFQSLLNDKTNGPVLRSALMKFQKYVSHSDSHGMDFYQSLQMMAQPSKSDPHNPKAVIPNPDAGAAQAIAGAFGNGDPRRGWAVLQSYHEEAEPEQIENEAQAADMIASSEPGSRAYKYAQRWIASNTAQKAAVARAGAEARASVKSATDSAAANASSGQPDALGFTPNVSAMGGVKEYNKRFNSYKKNLDDLARTEASYQQFGSTLSDLASGKDMTGAQSVVALFNAIGLSATPLAGRGFRITENTIKEHQQARGWGQALQAKLLGAKDGDVITPQQLKDYATLAQQARQSAYVNLANELHSAGLSSDPALPTGNGQKIDAPTARIFLTLTNNDPNKARQAAAAKGWSF